MVNTATTNVYGINWPDTLELTDKETIETTLDSINKKIDKKTNELEGRFDLINKNFGWALFFIIILLIYIAKWKN